MLFATMTFKMSNDPSVIGPSFLQKIKGKNNVFIRLFIFLFYKLYKLSQYEAVGCFWVNANIQIASQSRLFCSYIQRCVILIFI